MKISRRLSCSLVAGVLALAAPAARAQAPADLEDLVRIHRGTDGARISLAEMLAELARDEVVFIGETHLDEVTHRTELAILEGLVARRADKVVLSLEMFARDAQAPLDEYLQGSRDEAALLRAAHPWGNYATGYRALIEVARRSHLPVVAANIPAGVRRAISRGGQKAFEALSEQERPWVARELLPTSQAYWDRFAAVMSGHGGPSMPMGNPQKMIYGGQSLWDNTMAESIASALAAHPGYALVHVVGGFHVEYRQGTCEQLLARVPDARVQVVTIRPVSDLAAPLPADDLERGDFVVCAQRRGRGLSEGSYGMELPFELRYRLHLPSATDLKTARPLLIWLHDRGARESEALAYWKAVLGDEAAVAVIEAPYPLVRPDLTLGGRWSWPARADEDARLLGVGLARMRDYLVRYFPIDAERIVVAGEGRGATAALDAIEEHGDLEVDLAAVQPRGWNVRARGEVARAVRSLAFLAPERLAEGMRSLLGLAPRRLEKNAPEILLVLASSAPLGRSWAAIHAQVLRSAGRRARVVRPREVAGARAGAEIIALRVKPADYADGAGLPRPASPFGGTTILVLPAGLSAEQARAWEQLEKDKVLSKRSRFNRLRIARSDGKPALEDTLAELRDSGRHTVLIVPAQYCASVRTLRDLKRRATPFEEEMKISWLPGLGGNFHHRKKP